MNPIIFSLSLIGLGLVWLGYCGYWLHWGGRTTRWQETRGRVLHFLDNPDFRWSSAFGTAKPDVDYTYEVNGRDYRGGLVSVGPDPGASLFGDSINERRARRYREGSEVEVYYNPLRPADAVLERGVSHRMVVSHAFFAVISLALGLITLRLL